MEEISVNLEAEAGCSTNTQFAGQGDENVEDGAEVGNSKARDESNRVDNRVERIPNYLNSRLDLGEIFADHIGSLAQADGEPLEGELAQEPKQREEHVRWRSL